MLFALIVSEFITKIKKDWLIENTTLELPIDNPIFITRIKSALEGIDLPGIELSDDEINYDYSEQSDILLILLEKKSL